MFSSFKTYLGRRLSAGGGENGFYGRWTGKREFLRSKIGSLHRGAAPTCH